MEAPAAARALVFSIGTASATGDDGPGMAHAPAGGRALADYQSATGLLNSS